MLLILGGFGLVIGAMYLFNKDTAWDIDSRRYRVMGLEPERTPAWDARANWQGGLMMAVGLLLLVFGVVSTSDTHRPAMSGSYIDGRELTVDEQKRMERNPGAFLTQNCVEHPDECRPVPSGPTAPAPRTGP